MMMDFCPSVCGMFIEALSGAVKGIFAKSYSE